MSEPQEHASIEPKNTTLLLVDDDPFVLDLLALELAELGLQVTTAGNGVEALAQIRKQLPDIILTDILMPEMDGFGLCRELLADPELAELPVIFLTGEYLREEDEQLAFKLGVRRYLIKPQRAADLLQVIQDELAQEAPPAVTLSVPESDSVDEAHKARLIDQLTLKLQQLQRTQDNLAASDARYRNLLQSAPDAILVSDAQGVITLLNEQAEQLLGYSREELIGQPVEILVPEPQVAEHIQQRDKIFAGEQELLYKHRQKRFHARHKGGELIPVEINLGIKSVGTGRICTAVIRDMREHEKAEQEAIQLREEKLKAELLSLAKSSFLANMSHEIRTPMNAIIGLTYLLQCSGLAPEHQQKLDKIGIAAKHLLSIINDVLDLSKIDAGKLLLDKQQIQLQTLYQETEALLAGQAHAKGIELIFSVDPRDPNLLTRWFSGDSVRIRQSLLNLVSNAIKFTEQGSVLIRAKQMERLAGRVKLRVEIRDSGIGIAPETLGKLFSEFEQGDNSTTRKYGGTGLGLAITRRLVELMDGEVGAKSVLGSGSTFWFTLWVDAGETQQPEVPPLLVDADITLLTRFAGARILVVEDNAINREVVTAMLQGVGLAVDEAEDGVQALELVRATEYDLLLMDLHMPHMDGLEATRQIRALAPTQALPIIALSASVFIEDRQQCLQAGMDDFLAKPVNPEELYQYLVKWLPERAVSENRIPGGEADIALLRRLAYCKGVDLRMGLRLLRGNVTRYLQLVRSFGRNHGQAMEELGDLNTAAGIVQARQRLQRVNGAASVLHLRGPELAALAFEQRLQNASHLTSAEIAEATAQFSAALDELNRLLS